MMGGKNFSCNNLGQRKKSDFYETPYSLTWQLLENEGFDFSRKVLEPSCGNGAISNELIKKFGPENVEYSDISEGHDFLLREEWDKVDYIITNPPFSLAMEFILKAKKIAKNKFAFLLPLSYLHGEERYNKIYKDIDFPLSHIYVFTRYPMLGEPLRDDGKYNTGMMVYAWYVWDKKFWNDPEIRWISNQKYVLKKGE